MLRRILSPVATKAHWVCSWGRAHQISLNTERSYFSGNRVNKPLSPEASLPFPALSRLTEGKARGDPGPGPHMGRAHSMHFRKAQSSSGCPLSELGASPHLGLSLYRRSEVTASKSMSPVCLLVLWEPLSALAWFSPSVKALPRGCGCGLMMFSSKHVVCASECCCSPAALPRQSRGRFA